MQRFLAIAVGLSLALSVSVSRADAHASVESEPHRNFVVEAFPHPSSDVAFRDTWGQHRSGGRRHKGTDILSPRGTPIVAVADGTVVFMGEQRLSGYVITISHGGGWTTTYMHLNNDEPGTDNGEGGRLAAFAAGLYEGARVEAGQRIGWVGDSGNAERTTPHTHFELTHDGEKLNPYPFLQAAWLRSAQWPNGFPPPTVLL